MFGDVFSRVQLVVAEFEEKEDFHFEGTVVQVSEEKLEDVSGIPIYNDENYPPIAPMPHYPESPTLDDAVMKLLKVNLLSERCKP